MLGKEELGRLADSILDNGQQFPIILFEGKILDGRNRFKVCELLGVKPEFKGFVGDREAAIKFVTAANIDVKQLTPSQRSVAAAKLANLGEGRPAKETASREAVSQAEAAKLMGVGRSTVQRAQQVIEKGVPELAEAVEQGEVHIKTAVELTRLPEAEQREVLAAGKEKVKETVKELRASPPARQEPSEDQQALRRRQKTESLFGDLVSSILLVKKTVDQMAGTDMVMLPGDRELAEMAVGELQSVAGWLETLLKGEGVPDELPSWLDGGSK